MSDHGVNLERGFLGESAELEQLHGKDIGSILVSVGTILMSTVGGSGGSLYGFIHESWQSVQRKEGNHRAT